jgi:hypothetical protein
VKCWRIDLQTKLASYLHGSLSASAMRSMEDHLIECAACREQLSKTLEGDRLAAQLPSMKGPDHSWIRIEARLKSSNQQSERHHVHLMRAAIGGVSAIIAVLILLMARNGIFQELKSDETRNFNRASFREVALRNFEANTEPHVTTEGYVSEMRVRDEDGRRMFKLVDNLNRPNHFVVCEIIAPSKLPVPATGSRIRVYGVSRYDGKGDHQWYEVHPVLDIEPAP